MARSVDELAKDLKKMYDDSERDKMAKVILFGIKFVEDLKEKGKVKEVVEKAFNGKYESFYVEVNNGKQLAKYVTVNS